MSDKDGGPAFPMHGKDDYGAILNHGMTLRDYFAAKAMTGIIGRIQYRSIENLVFPNLWLTKIRLRLTGLFLCKAHNMRGCLFSLPASRKCVKCWIYVMRSGIWWWKT